MRIISGLFILPAFVFVAAVANVVENLIVYMTSNHKAILGSSPIGVKPAMNLLGKILTIPTWLVRRIAGLYPRAFHPDFYHDYRWVFE